MFPPSPDRSVRPRTGPYPPCPAPATPAPQPPVPLASFAAASARERVIAFTPPAEQLEARRRFHQLRRRLGEALDDTDPVRALQIDALAQDFLLRDRFRAAIQRLHGGWLPSSMGQYRLEQFLGSINGSAVAREARRRLGRGEAPLCETADRATLIAQLQAGAQCVVPPRAVYRFENPAYLARLVAGVEPPEPGDEQLLESLLSRIEEHLKREAGLDSTVNEAWAKIQASANDVPTDHARLTELNAQLQAVEDRIQRTLEVLGWN